jgi:hypothetical protein
VPGGAAGGAPAFPVHSKEVVLTLNKLTHENLDLIRHMALAKQVGHQPDGYMAIHKLVGLYKEVVLTLNTLTHENLDLIRHMAIAKQVGTTLASLPPPSSS